MQEKISERINKILANEDIPRYLYFAAFIMYVAIRTWDTTMFPRIMLLNNLGLITAFGLIGLKMLFYDSFRKAELAFDVIALAIGVISYFHGGSIHFLFLFWFAMGSHKMDFQEIIQVYLVVVASICILAFVGARLGIIEELIYYLPSREDFLWLKLKKAYSLGGIYRTDTAARIFFWLLAFFYGRKTGIVFSIVLFVLSAVVYILTQGRLDASCILILSVLSLIDTLCRESNSINLNRLHSGFWKVIGVLSMPIAAIVSILVTVLYGSNIGFLNSLNSLISGRLSIGYDAIQKYGINLFGHEMQMFGFGGAVEAEFYESLKAYNYVDVSFVQILLMNGTLVLCSLVFVYTYLAWKNRKDSKLMICIFLIALNCIVAQHLMDISYVPFIMLYTAENRVIGKYDKRYFG